MIAVAPALAPDDRLAQSYRQPVERLCTESPMLKSGPAAVAVCPAREGKGQRGRLCASFYPPGCWRPVERNKSMYADIIKLSERPKRPSRRGFISLGAAASAVVAGIGASSSATAGADPILALIAQEDHYRTLGIAARERAEERLPRR